MITCLQIAHTEITVKNLKKEDFISLVLNLQSECDQFIDRWGQHIDNLISLVDNDVSKFTQVKSSLMVTKTVNKELSKRVASLEKSRHSQEIYSRRECLEEVGIP